MESKIAVVALLAWLAFVMSRTLQRRKVPELVGFIGAGVVVGPSGLGLLSDDDLVSLRPLTEVALAALMFLVGERLSWRALRGARWIVASGIGSYVVSAGVVGGAAWSVGADAPTTVVLAVLAGAGAPMTMASVMASVRARGQIASGLVGAHAVSDALAAVAFAVAIPAAAVLQGTGTAGESVQQSLRLGLGAIGLGVAFGLLVLRMARRVDNAGELLVLVLVHLFLVATVADLVDIALPLTSLVIGATVAASRHADTAQHLFSSMRSIEQPLYLVFFAVAGAAIHLDDVASLGLVGAVYVIGRSIGKIAGGFLGAMVGGLDARRSITVGADMLPQAGVAVALAVLAAEILGDPGRGGAAIVLGSVVLFEVVGPVIVSRTVGGLELDAAGPVDERMPDSVLLATMGELEVPAWILSWCAQTGGTLTVLAPGVTGPAAGEDGAVDLLRARCSEEGVALHWRNLDSDLSHDFASTVATVALEVGADLVAVVVPPLEMPAQWLRRGPVERLPMTLNAPVVILPGGGETRPAVAT